MARLSDLFFNISHRRLLGIAFLAALAESLLLVILVGYDRGIGTDGAFYSLSGYNLFRGLGFTYSDVPNTFTWPLLSIFTGFLSLFLDDLQLCMHIVLTAAFAFGVLPFYGLVKNIMDEKAARIGLVMYVLNGFLMRMSTRMTAESLLVFFVILSAYYFSVLITDLRRGNVPSMWKYGCTGLSLGLAYLTKPEGFLFFAFGTAFLLFFTIRRGMMTVSWFRLIILLVLFVATIAPQILFIHRNTGKWELTTYNRFLFRGYVEPLLTLSPGDAAANRKVEYNYNAYIVRGPYTAENLTKDIRKTPDHLAKYFRGIWTLVGPLCLFGLLLSFFFSDWRRGPRGLVYSYLFPVLGVFFWYNPTERMFLAFLPFFIVVTLYSILQLNGRWSGRPWRRAAIMGLLGLSIAFSFRPISNNSPTNAVIGNHRLMGQWIRRNLPEMEGKLLADRKPYIAFDARALYYRYTSVRDYETLIDRLKKDNVEYLIVDDFYTRTKNPGVVGLLDAKDTPDLKFIHKEEDPTWGLAILYKVIKESAN